MHITHVHSNPFALCERCVASVALSGRSEFDECLFLSREAIRLDNLSFLCSRIYQISAPHLVNFVRDFPENLRLIGVCLQFFGRGVAVMLFTLITIFEGVFPEFNRSKSAAEQDFELKQSERKNQEFRIKKEEQWAWEEARRADLNACDAERYAEFYRDRDKHERELERMKEDEERLKGVIISVKAFSKKKSEPDDLVAAGKPSKTTRTP